MKTTVLTLVILAAFASGCQSNAPTASSVIEAADLVPRSEACRAFRPAQIPSTSPPELINYVVAADAAHQTFCKEN